jgi:hypothetical protein
VTQLTICAITGSEKLLERLIGKDIELVVVLDPELGRVKADPGQLEQIIMNLAVNARDAMPAGGRLTIEMTNVDLDEEYATRHSCARGPHVMLAISDTGCGMDAETKAIYSRRFSRPNRSEKAPAWALRSFMGSCRTVADRFAYTQRWNRRDVSDLHSRRRAPELPQTSESAHKADKE